MLSVASSLAGRYGYAVASSFLWLTAAASIIFGLVITLPRLPTWWLIGALAVFIGVAWCAAGTRLTIGAIRWC